MNYLRPIGGLFLLTLFSFGVQATNRAPSEYHLNDNDTVQVTLSSVDLNRLTVKDDAISSVHCPSGFCVIDKQNDSSGGVLLSVKSSAMSTQSGDLVYPPFTLFIDTQLGRHFGVLVVPLAQPAQTAIFTVKENQVAALMKKQKNTPYLTQLTSLMKNATLAAEQQSELSGFEQSIMQVNTRKCDALKFKKHAHAAQTQCIEKQKETFLQGEALKVNALPRRIYHNGYQNVIVYELFNNTNHSERIAPEDFYVEGLQALTIQPPISMLKPKHSVMMIQIVDGTGEQHE